MRILLRVPCIALWAVTGCASYFRAAPVVTTAAPEDSAFAVQWQSRGIKGLTLEHLAIASHGVQSIPLAAESCEGAAEFAGEGGKPGQLPATVIVTRRPNPVTVAVELDSTSIRTFPAPAATDTLVVPVPATSQPKITLRSRCAGFCRFTGIASGGTAGPSNTVIARNGECWQGETVSMMTGESRRYRISLFGPDSGVTGVPVLVELRQAER